MIIKTLSRKLTIEQHESH